MGIYGKNDNLDTGIENMDELMESFIFDELSQLTDEQKAAFVVSEEAKIMLERGTISKKTIVRLNKTDDLSRRIKMAAFQAAKEKGDPIWDLLVKNRIKERDLISKLVQKYDSKATQAAKLGQRDYLKNRMSTNFMRPQKINPK